MTAPHALHLSHIALTVRDLDASVDWYGKVFGVSHKLDVPHQGGVGRILADDTMSLVFALHEHDANEGEAFRETRTGLDHVGFSVPARTDVEAWQQHLETHGVERVEVADRPLTQSPIADEVYGAVLVFRDADNIQLEIHCPPAP
jgi:catechol 2,3-dioxygenase-like lactoylglutathione lyase family enzyme